MNKRGFTLVEILATLGIISMLLLVVVPNIFSLRNKMKDRAYEQKMKLIEKAAHNYVDTNKRKIIYDCEYDHLLNCENKGDYYELTLTPDELVRVGALEKEKLINSNTDNCSIYNPKDNSCITSPIKIKLYKNGTDIIMNLVQGANPNSPDVIVKPSPSGSSCTNTLIYDGTSQNNIRYVGKNPCNYVSFNNEIWRIIGIMNGVDGAGSNETRIKLIRKDPIMENIVWDPCPSDTKPYVTNDYTKSLTKDRLNGIYLDSNLTTDIDWIGDEINSSYTYDHNLSLNSDAQSLIGSTKWYLGGHDKYSNNYSAKGFYSDERGKSTWGSPSDQICNDGACPRATEWTGRVALPYPSDFGFASNYGNRNYCLQNILNPDWPDNFDEMQMCNSNNWFPETWFLTPDSSESYAVYLFKRSNWGNSFRSATVGEYGNIHPTVYLRSDVSVVGGNGSLEKPYTFSKTGT